MKETTLLIASFCVWSFRPKLVINYLPSELTLSPQKEAFKTLVKIFTVTTVLCWIHASVIQCSFLYFFPFLPSSRISPCGWTDWGVLLPPTLGAACYIALGRALISIQIDKYENGVTTIGHHKICVACSCFCSCRKNSHIFLFFWTNIGPILETAWKHFKLRIGPLTIEAPHFQA